MKKMSQINENFDFFLFYFKCKISKNSQNIKSTTPHTNDAEHRKENKLIL